MSISSEMRAGSAVTCAIFGEGRSCGGDTASDSWAFVVCCSDSSWVGNSCQDMLTIQYYVSGTHIKWPWSEKRLDVQKLACCLSWRNLLCWGSRWHYFQMRSLLTQGIFFQYGLETNHKRFGYKVLVTCLCFLFICNKPEFFARHPWKSEHELHRVSFAALSTWLVSLCELLPPIDGCTERSAPS